MNGLTAFLLASRSRSTRVAVGLACAAIATAARLGLTIWVGRGVPWATYLLAVLFSSLFAGVVGATAALLASTVLGTVVFVTHGFSWPAPRTEDVVTVTLFMIVGGAVAAVGVWLRHALRAEHRRAVALEREVRRRQTAEAALAAENEALSRLRAVGERCSSSGVAVMDSLEEILATALWIADADKGNIQLYDDVSGTLDLVVHRGLPPRFVQFFEHVGGDDAATCGASFRTGERVAAEDVTTSPVFAGQPALDVLLDAGIRAVQSTPLRSSHGVIIGMISTHWSRPHRLDERAGRLLDILAQQTADYLERRRADDDVRAATERLRLVTDTMAAPVTRCSRDLRYIWASKPYADWLGVPLERIVGRPIVDVLGREAFEQLRPHFERVLSGEVVHYEEQLRLSGGRCKWITAAYTPTLDRDGACDGWVAAIVDIDERKRMEESLRESEQRFRVLADSVPVHVWMHDERGQDSLVNARYLEYTGADEAAVRRGSWPDVLHPDDREPYLATYRAAASAHASFRAEARLRGRDGRYRWFEFVGAPRFEGRRFAGYVGVSIDVSDRKDAEEALEEANRRKDEFLAMLGHELRNPLAAIRNAVATASLDQGQRTVALAIARRQTEQLGRLVDDLLDVARITQGRINLRREPALLQSIVRHAAEASQPYCEARGHALRVDVPAEDVWVDGDATRLEQVLVNLLSNACKYTNPRGRISLAAARERTTAVIRVRDSGVGIAPELLSRVFEPFTQAERNADRAQGGLGIGLTIAQRIVELHGGRIQAFSEGVGKGAEFVVTLPLVPDDRVPSVAMPTARPGPPGPSRVLMVEDNPDAAESLQLLLEVLGHRVDVAHDGPEALAAAHAHPPDVMLVDIGLPGMDGYEVARKVRSDPALRGVVLVALTGYGREEDRRAAFAAGFDHHLVKPVDPDNLEKLIRGVARPGGAEPETLH
jgi:two-component system CheB/CheR fusion protein